MRETNNEGSYLERSEASVLTPGFFCVQGVNVMDGVHTMMQELLLLTIPDVAIQLGVCRNAAYNLIYYKGLSSVLLGSVRVPDRQEDFSIILSA